MQNNISETKLLVCKLLSATTVPDESVRVPADKQLLQWELQQGFTPLLLVRWMFWLSPIFIISCQDIAMDGLIDADVRLAAAIMCKNSVERHWKKREGRGEIQERNRETGFVRELIPISAADKVNIKTKLLETILEKNDKVN